MRPRGPWWVTSLYARGVASRVWARALDGAVDVLAAARSPNRRRAEVLIGAFDPHDGTAPAAVAVRVDLAGINRLRFARRRRYVGVAIFRVPATGAAPTRPQAIGKLVVPVARGNGHGVGGRAAARGGAAAPAASGCAALVETRERVRGRPRMRGTTRRGMVISCMAAPTATAGGGVLELTDLRRTFGPVTALDGLSLAVAPGKLFGFVGRNGAGKTTTMRIVCGLLAPDSGTVTWRGQADRLARRASGSATCPRSEGCIRRCGRGDQLEYFGVLHGRTHAQARSAAKAWLERLGLGDRVNAKVEELSQGNQQRVQLAAALVHRPDLLVLDEPFAGLDPIVTDLLTGVLREEAARGVPVLFSSHQLELVEHICEAVAIIDRGRLVACGAGRGAAGGRCAARPHRGARCRSRLDRRPRGRRRSWSATEARWSWSSARRADSQRVLDAARQAGRRDGVRRVATDAGRAVPRAGGPHERPARDLGGRSPRARRAVALARAADLDRPRARARRRRRDRRRSRGSRARPPTMSASSARARWRWRRRCASRPERPGAASALHRLGTAAAAKRAVRDGGVDVALVDGSRLIVRRSRVRARP